MREKNTLYIHIWSIKTIGIFLYIFKLLYLEKNKRSFKTRLDDDGDDGFLQRLHMEFDDEMGLNKLVEHAKFPEHSSATPNVKNAQPEALPAAAPVVAKAQPEAPPVALKVGAAPAVVNSMTHPAAWAWLHRNCRADEPKVPQEVLDDWLAGGTRKNKLLHSFVQRVYQPNQSHQVTALRLEAWNKIRQVTKDFTRSFQGFEWKTEDELKKMDWSEILVVCCFISFLSYVN